MKQFSEPIISRPVDGSLLFWMNGNSRRRNGTLLADLSGQKNNGTITYGAGLWKNTPLGHSVLDFDGADTKIDLGSDFIGTSACSICAWIYPESLGEGNLGTVISNGKTHIYLPAAYSIRLRSDGATSATSAVGLTQNAWNFITATRTTTGVANLYINGVLSGTANQNSGAPAGGTTNVILGNLAASTWTFDGKIDDLRVHNKVMTSNEIMKLYQETKHLYGF